MKVLVKKLRLSGHTSIDHFRNEEETGAKMRPAVVSGIPEVFTPRFLSSEWDLIHVYKEYCRTARLRRESVLG